MGGHMGAGMVQEEQAEWQSVAIMAPAALLRVKIAQLAVSAAGVTVRVRWLTWAVATEITSRRLHLPDYVVLSVEPVASDPTSSVAVVRDSDVATIRLRVGFRTVGDYLVSSSTGVLLLNDGKGLHHSSP